MLRVDWLEARGDNEFFCRLAMLPVRACYICGVETPSAAVEQGGWAARMEISSPSLSPSLTTHTRRIDALSVEKERLLRRRILWAFLIGLSEVITAAAVEPFITAHFPQAAQPPASSKMHQHQYIKGRLRSPNARPTPVPNSGYFFLPPPLLSSKKLVQSC